MAQIKPSKIIKCKVTIIRVQYKAKVYFYCPKLLKLKRIY